MNSKYIFSSHIRNFTFGVEDSLVSTVGLLSGIASADIARPTILLTGVVLIFVEAFSMGVGSFLSEFQAESYEKGNSIKIKNSVMNGLIMFVSYILAGLIPISPYIFISSNIALHVSMIFAIISLTLLGLITAKISKISAFKNMIRMVVIGGLAILIGVIVSNIIIGV